MKTISIRWFAAIVAATLMTGCGPSQEVADKTVADIEASVNSLRGDASRYAPTELQQVDSALASLKSDLGKGDYKAVVAGAPAVSSQVSTLQQTVTAKREEAHAAMAAASGQWQALSAEVPNMIAAIQSRVDTLGQSRKLPKNLTKDSFQAAKDGLEFMKTNWTEATAQFGSGDPVGAVAKAQAARDRGTEVLKLLGMEQQAGA